MTNLENAGGARVKPDLLLAALKNHASHAGDGAFLAFMGNSQNVSSKQALQGENVGSDGAASLDDPMTKGDKSAHKSGGGGLHITVFGGTLRPTSLPIAKANTPPLAAAFGEEARREAIRPIAATMPTDEPVMMTSLAAPETQAGLPAQEVPDLGLSGQVTLDVAGQFANTPLVTAAQIATVEGRTARPNKAGNQDHSTEATPDTRPSANALPMRAATVTPLQPWVQQISTDQDLATQQSVHSIGQADKTAFGHLGVETRHATVFSRPSPTTANFANAAVADRAIDSPSKATDPSQTEPFSQAPVDRAYQYGAPETTDHGPMPQLSPPLDAQRPAAPTDLQSPTAPRRSDDAGKDHNGPPVLASTSMKPDASVDQHLQKKTLMVERDVPSHQADLPPLRHAAASAMERPATAKAMPNGSAAKPILASVQDNMSDAATNGVKRADTPAQTPIATPKIEAQKNAAFPNTYPDHLRQMPTKQIAPLASLSGPTRETETEAVHAKPAKTSHFAPPLDIRHEAPTASVQQKTALYDIREPARPIEKPTFFDTIAPSPALPAITSATHSPAAIVPLSHIPVPISTVPLHIKTLLSTDKPSTLELTLAPEELGKLRLVMVPEGDKIRIVIQAERPETLELLRRNTENFASDLRQSGYAEASFSFSGWNDQPASTPTPKDRCATHFSGGADETSTKPMPYTAQIKGTGLDLRV